MLISIVIPVYNGEKTIGRALDSLIVQTQNTFEVIVINDGSIDNTIQILEIYKKKFDAVGKKIKIINQNNLGVSAARNRGIKEAKGEYIAFLDSDDYLKTNMVEVLYSYLNKTKYDCIIYGFYSLNNIEEIEMDYYNPELIQGKDKLKGKLDELLPTRALNSPCNKLFNKEILDKNKIKFNKKLSLGEDLNFNLMYYFNINNLKIINERLYVIDNSSSYLSVKYRENYYEDRISALREMKNTYYVNNIDQEIFNWLYIKLVYACIFNTYRKESKLTDEERYKYLKDIINEKEIKDAINAFKAQNIYQKALLYLLKTHKYRIVLFLAKIFSEHKENIPMCLRKVSV